jgi:hypothetical protein
MPSTTSIHYADASGWQQPISPLRLLASYANASCVLLFTRRLAQGEHFPVCGDQNDPKLRTASSPLLRHWLVESPLEVLACPNNRDQLPEKLISPYTTNMPYAVCPRSSPAENRHTSPADYVSASSTAYSQAVSRNAGKIVSLSEIQEGATSIDD